MTQDDDEAAIFEQKAAHYGEQAEADAERAESFLWAATVDHLDVLTLGLNLLDELRSATQPAGLLASIDLISKDDRRDVVSAVFAAVVWEMLRHNDAPPSIRELDRRWLAASAEEGKRARKPDGESGA